MAVRLGDLAERIGAELHGGNPDCLISRVATLDTAQEGDVSFLFNRRYRKFLKVTGASAVIIGPLDLEACPVPVLVTGNPYLGYARVAALLSSPVSKQPGIHPTACVASVAKVDPSAYVGPHTVIEEGACLGANTFVGPGCIIGQQVQIGDYTRLIANITVLERTSIGRRCIIHPGVVIGADGFGLARDKDKWVKIPQLGSIHIGDDVEIGANTTIDRGALKDTIIEDGVKLDNQIQIGHNVHIGAHTAIAGCVGIAGSAKIGKRCVIGGGAGITGHIEIADDVIISAKAEVTKSISKPGTYSSVWPAKEDREWKKKIALFNRLDRLVRQLEAVEKNNS